MALRVYVEQFIEGEAPHYPQGAKERHSTGEVVMRVDIGTDGVIRSLHLLEFPDPELAAAAMDAVRTWRYKPYLVNGKPTEDEQSTRRVENTPDPEATMILCLRAKLLELEKRLDDLEDVHDKDLVGTPAASFTYTPSKSNGNGHSNGHHTKLDEELQDLIYMI